MNRLRAPLVVGWMLGEFIGFKLSRLYSSRIGSHLLTLRFHLHLIRIVGLLYSMVSSHYTQNSPQLSAGGMPMSYGMPMGRGNIRAPSFDDGSMLPPSAIDAQDQGNPTYSPYSQASSSGGTLFQHQPWGYATLPEMYSNSQVSPLQPRPTHQIPMGYPMAPQMRPMGPYGAYYPACSPGPPIQTTASNKG